MKFTEKHIIYRSAGEYTLLEIRDAEAEPFVVAWKYNEERGDWAQGHYFPNGWLANQFLKQKANKTGYVIVEEGNIPPQN